MKTVLDDFLVKIAESTLGQGVKVEAEHGGTIDWVRGHPKAPKSEIYKRIAKDHLKEDKHYYRDLKTMEEFEDEQKEKKAENNDLPVQKLDDTSYVTGRARLKPLIQKYSKLPTSKNQRYEDGFDEDEGRTIGVNNKDLLERDFVKRAYWMGDHVKMVEQAATNLREKGVHFSDAQVKRIADSNFRADVDNDLRFGLSPWRTPFHNFANKKQQAKKIIRVFMDKAVKAKNTDEAMDALGIATHTQQDRYSHADLGAVTGIRGALQHLGPLKPDSIEKRPEQANKALKKTEAMLEYYVRAGGPMGKVTDAKPYHRAILEHTDDFLKKLAQVDPYQQLRPWTCSAACLRAVLLHHGEDWPESVLVPLIGAKPSRGAECDEIAEAARMIGFMAFEYSFESLDQARVLLDQDIPIICDIQSFKHPGKGHYVVMTHIDDEGVHLMDPNAPELSNERVISVEEMGGRWWDRAMAPPHDLMNHHGIIVVPRD